MGETVVFGLSVSQISLALSLVAAYGLALVYVYQTGFFSAVGFEYAGLTSPLELWSNAGRLAAYLGGTFVAVIVTMFAFQAANQSEFDLSGWLVKHETPIFAGVLIVTALPALLTFLGRRSDLDHYVMVGNLMLLLIFTYAHSQTDLKYSVWQIVMAAIYPAMLSGGLGFNHGFSARMLNSRRYNVYFDEKRYIRVRLIRASSSGILFVPDDGGGTGFINASKVEKITIVKL